MSIYQTLYSWYGPQKWWPGDSPFEVMVGAILTQNTNWHNVEIAIKCLKQAHMMNAHMLLRHARKVPKLIRPTGYYRQKTTRLLDFCDYYIDRYDACIRNMKHKQTKTLRCELLSIRGIGPETADSILLYALNRPVFVIDAYTRRALSRHGLCSYDSPYSSLQTWCEASLPHRTKLFSELHALLVKLGKEYCRKHEPLCDRCPVQHSFSV